MEHRTIDTPWLRIAYEEIGRPNGDPIVLVHGWPDDVRCWDAIAPRLADAGARVLTPYLRGCGPTRFHSPNTMRSGAIAALGQDLADFLGALDLRGATVVGYDWGARAGYVGGALFPERIRGLVAMAAGYATSQPIAEMPYDLVKAYWYEWLVATEQGRAAIMRDRRRMARYLWQTWSPGWQFTDEEFERSAASWDNDDWAPISIHAYQQRWGDVAGAPQHENIERRLAAAPPIRVPTIVLHGAVDGDNFVETSAGKDRYFLDTYERTVLDGIGHFIPREAPDKVIEAVRRFNAL